MITKFVEAFKKNKDKVRTALSQIDAYSDFEYENLLEIIISNGFAELNISTEIQLIDFGEYQGTLILAFHEDVYQPLASQTYYTSVEYGSCTVCDTLQRIMDDEEQVSRVDDLMTLCLHMVQNIYQFKAVD